MYIEEVWIGFGSVSPSFGLAMSYWSISRMDTWLDVMAGFIAIPRE
jgi:hypothetical protein